VIYLKQSEMSKPSQKFGLETNKRAVVGQYNTRYHSTNEEETVISYTDFFEKSSRQSKPAILWHPQCKILIRCFENLALHIFKLMLNLL
jgi:hypothetical protein